MVRPGCVPVVLHTAGLTPLLKITSRFYVKNYILFYFLQCYGRKTVKLSTEIKQFFILDLEDVTVDGTDVLPYTQF